MNLLKTAMVGVVLVAFSASAVKPAVAEEPQQQQTTSSSSSTTTTEASTEEKKDEKADGKDGKKDGKPAAAGALANAVQARTPEEQANQSGFQVQVSLDHYFGAGTFVDPKLYSYLAANLTLGVQYLFRVGGVRLVASGTARAMYEYTLPDSETGRRFMPGDTAIRLGAPALFRDKAITGIAVSPSIGFNIPTSPESWNAGLITSLAASLAATRSFTTPIGGIDLRFTLGGSRGIFTSRQNNVRVDPNAVDAAGNRLCIARAGESTCGTVGMNTAWSFTIGGNVNYRVTGDLMFYVGYTFIKTWREAAALTKDDYTAKGVDSNGNPLARAGMGQVDRTSAFVGLSYQLNEHYSLDFGVSTIQTPLTPTGQVRFPFLSFGTWADNATTAYFTLTAAY